MSRRTVYRPLSISLYQKFNGNFFLGRVFRAFMEYLSLSIYPVYDAVK